MHRTKLAAAGLTALVMTAATVASFTGPAWAADPEGCTRTVGTAVGGGDTIICTQGIQPKTTLIGTEAGDDITITGANRTFNRLGTCWDAVMMGDIETLGGADVVRILADQGACGIASAPVRHLPRLSTGAGPDVVTITGGDETQSLLGGHGGDGLHQGEVFTGDGDDVVTITGGASPYSGDGGEAASSPWTVYRTAVSTGEGSDTITLTGGAGGRGHGVPKQAGIGVQGASINAGDGPDIIVVTGGSGGTGEPGSGISAEEPYGYVFGQGGNDTITVSGGTANGKLGNSVEGTLSGGSNLSSGPGDSCTLVGPVTGTIDECETQVGP